jgi:hypothetical protein
MEDNQQIEIKKDKNLKPIFWMTNFGLLTQYWAFLFIPFTIQAVLTANMSSMSSSQRRVAGFYMGNLFMFLIFFAPILIIIPYRRAKFSRLIKRIFFIFFGLSVPYIIMLLVMSMIAASRLRFLP